jgi:hypothetical protein
VASLAGSLFTALASPAQADVITDWNQRSAQIIGDARIGPPPALRVMALVRPAAYEAAREAARAPSAPAHAVDAAVTGAHHAALTQLLPAQRAAVEAATQAALATLADNGQRTQNLAEANAPRSACWPPVLATRLAQLTPTARIPPCMRPPRPRP